MAGFPDAALARIFQLYRHAVRANEETRILQEELLRRSSARRVARRRRRLGTCGAVCGTRPESPPRVTSQDAVKDGRTDLQVQWPGHRELVLELKVSVAPEIEQVRCYLEAKDPALEFGEWAEAQAAELVEMVSWGAS